MHNMLKFNNIFASQKIKRKENLKKITSKINHVLNFVSNAISCGLMFLLQCDVYKCQLSRNYHPSNCVRLYVCV